MAGLLDDWFGQNSQAGGLLGSFNQRFNSAVENPAFQMGLALMAARPGRADEAVSNAMSNIAMQRAFAAQRADRLAADKRDQRDFERLQANDKFNQGVQTQQLGLQQQQFAEQQKLNEQNVRRQAPQTVTTEDANGNKSTFQFDPASNQWKPLSGVAPSASGVPNNPLASGHFNNEQGKAAGFADRMLLSEPVLRETQGINSGWQGGAAGTLANTNIPGTHTSFLPNAMRSADRQKFDQAKRDFTNAVLRRESGAAISPSEFENSDKQYFPQPGDSPEVIVQKQSNRRAVMEAMIREGGKGYAPKFIFDQQGSLTPNPGAQPRSSDAPKPGGALDQQGGLPKLSSEQQFNALPSGTRFIAPDGSIRIKP